MDAFTEFLHQQLHEMLKMRSIVVFYDPRREFEPLFDRELEEVGTGYDGLPRVFVQDRLTFVAREQALGGLRDRCLELIAAGKKVLVQ